MKLKYKVLIPLIIITVYIFSHNFFTNQMIAGSYVYNFPVAVADGPRQGDKLLLNNDGSFQSDTWGNGTYKLSGSELKLSYTTAGGKASFTSTIYRPYFWGKPRIEIEPDLGHFFKKIY